MKRRTLQVIKIAGNKYSYTRDASFWCYDRSVSLEMRSRPRAALAGVTGLWRGQPVATQTALQGDGQRWGGNDRSI